MQSISFGLMDFLSPRRRHSANAHDIAGQFARPLVVRAKLEIAAACHAYGKVPSHCVVTEFHRPCRDAGCRPVAHPRNWATPGCGASIRRRSAPSRAFAPALAEVGGAHPAGGPGRQWAPSATMGVLHDRASYRYYWQLLERAHYTALRGAGPPRWATGLMWLRP